MLQYPQYRAAAGALVLVFPIVFSAACGRSEPTNNATLEYAKVNAAGNANGNANGTSTPTSTSTTTSTSPPTPSSTPDPSHCPAGMLLVEGEYCPDVEEVCLKWLDPPESRYHEFRCAEYKNPSVCKSKARVHKRFCIDETERKEADSDLPRNHMSWTSSKKLCESEGARVCFESEWQFACEGEEMRPYPYGWERNETICNTDIKEGLGRIGRLVDHRSAASAHPECKSPFGVHDQSGNVEEWVTADGKGKMGWNQVLKGSWWIPSRHACRSFQIGHTAAYGGGETGARCCKDAD
jgi:sulfatase modifying factor 1